MSEKSTKNVVGTILGAVVISSLMLFGGMTQGYVNCYNGPEVQKKVLAASEKALIQGSQEATRVFQKSAIEKGFAQYDATTGVWRWKTNEEMNFETNVLPNAGPDLDKMVPQEFPLPKKNKK